jgi:hypothetical protein
MSVSSSEIGVTRTYDGGTNQYYMETTDGTNYNEANFVSIAVGDRIAGLGQEPDLGANNAGNWTGDPPFPGQETQIVSFAYTAGTKACIQLNCNNVNQIRVLAQTIFPMFDDNVSYWDDLQAQAIVTGDKFITATDANLKGNTNVVGVCNGVSAATTSVNFYQPQLLSSDYYAVGIQTGTTDPKIFVAWNTGATHF